jgi:hypothetical protein
MNIQKNEPHGIGIRDIRCFENVCAGCHLPSMTIWMMTIVVIIARTLFELKVNHKFLAK